MRRIYVLANDRYGNDSEPRTLAHLQAQFLELWPEVQLTTSHNGKCVVTADGGELVATEIAQKWRK